KFGIDASTVSDILKKKDYYLNLNQKSVEVKSQRDCLPKFPQLETALALWLDNCINANLCINKDLLIHKAHNFAKLQNIINFTGSEGASIEELPHLRTELQTFLQNWDLNDIYNCDGIGLYWKMEPSKTLSTHSVASTKTSKDRVTVLLTCNAM
ncbi:4980_t:CDS:2, partial [Acaulospora morrowiae]